MENQPEPASYLFRTEPRTSEYNMGVMDALLWARHEVGNKDLPADRVRSFKGLMDAMIRECQDRRLESFENMVVPIRAEHERIDSLVDGCTFTEGPLEE
jgi:hypothetical protein